MEYIKKIQLFSIIRNAIFQEKNKNYGFWETY